MTFEQWLLSIGMKEKSAKNYTQAIFGSINRWAKDANLLNEDITTIKSLNEINSFYEKIKNLDEFVKFNTKGKGMYNAAMRHYINYVDDLFNYRINEDISSIVLQKDLQETEKVLLISARIGQGQFRKSLISYWKGCTITGFSNTKFLVASHIKPWRNSSNKERLDWNNGLLLLPNLDKAFDLGYISFDEDGTILISNQLDNCAGLGINKNQFIKVKDENRPYLTFHRENVFNRFQLKE